MRYLWGLIVKCFQKRKVDNMPSEYPSLEKLGLEGWIDYDRPKLNALAPMEQIDYFELRVRLVVINPLQRILDTEIRPTKESSALLIFGVSICCAIEALGKFLTGATEQSGVSCTKRFYAFLHKYMDSEYQTGKLGSNGYDYILWKYFRNGLAHGFSVKHGGFEGGPSSPYFTERNSTLEVNPESLYRDFVQAFEQYLIELRASNNTGEMFDNFKSIFEDVFIKLHFRRFFQFGSQLVLAKTRLSAMVFWF